MAKRSIIQIDETKCNGCAACIPNCPEGALQVIKGKARLVSDLFCDGLGACIGVCPQGAISIEEREAGPYDERKVMENVCRQGEAVIRAHLEHLRAHSQALYLKEAEDYLKEKGLPVPAPAQAPNAGGCAGSKVFHIIEEGKGPTGEGAGGPGGLKNWPIQLVLVPAHAPYLKGARLLIAADCTAFSYAGFHSELLAGRVLLVGCPKLDDASAYAEKLSRIIRQNDPVCITCVHMEVPCCYGLVNLVKSAIASSGSEVRLEEVTIGIKGDRKDGLQVSRAGQAGSQH